MSRIYEALQRAELERKHLASQDDSPALNARDAQPVCEPIPDAERIDLDSIARRPWALSVAELPTLADRGKGVEQFRSLRSRLHTQRFEGDFKTVLVSSGIPEEGKTFVAVNLAMSLANYSERGVLLIDADLRRPAAHRVLGASASPGLADYLENKASLAEIIQRGITPADAAIRPGKVSNVAFIPAGKARDNALELVCSHRVDELISQLSPLFDWIILDSPPVLVVTDAVDLARTADAILLVARAGHTPYPVAQKAHLAFKNSRMLGFVLNAVTDAREDDRYYSYYYEEDPASGSAPQRKRAKGSRQ